MKIFNKHVLIILSFLIFFTAQSWAGGGERILSLSTYLPAPYGYYNSLRADKVASGTVTSSSLLLKGIMNVGEKCQEGLVIYDEKNKQFKMCTDGTWANPSLWMLDEDNSAVTLIDTSWALGVGTVLPLAKLHAKGGFLLEGDSDADITFPLEGTAGIRLFWNPKTGALFSGYVDSDYDKYWKDENMGLYSAAMGSNVRAPGKAAAALGGSIHDASADYSAILGGRENTISSGGSAGSIIGGKNNKVASLGSVIIGGENVTIPAGKDYSVSIGRPLDGTNFTINTQKTIILHGERVGINRSDPSATLDVKGSILLGNDKEKGYAVRAGENVYLVGGYVTSGGSLSGATSNGISASRTSTGVYTITYSNLALNESPFISFTPIDSVPILANVTSLSKTQVTVKFYKASNSALTDVNFMFFGAGTLSSTSDGAIDQGTGGFGVNFGQ